MRMLLLSVCLLTVLSRFSLSNSTTVPLRILVLVPFPSLNGSKGWDRGLELLPAARVAVKEINSNPDLLAGYNIQLIERSHDACSESVISQGVINFIHNALQTESNNTNAIAVLGLACSGVAATLSPIAGREEVSLLQLAIANSHALRNQSTYPHLWRFLSSSEALVSSTVELMKKLNWRKVGLIYGGNRIFFNSLADSFREKVRSKNYTLLVDHEMDSTSGFVSEALDLIQSSRVRIIFAPAAIPEIIQILCQAAKKNMVWPGYVWIFPSRNLNELHANSDKCDNKELLYSAINNVMLINFELENRNSSATLVSGHTYEEYKEKYDRESDNLLKEEKFSNLLKYFNYTTDNPYANLMYNEVWALALAINKSLQDLKSRGFHLFDYEYNNSEITSIIESHLKDVSFAGTLGTVTFDKYREVTTRVGIYQIRNNREEIKIAVIKNDSLKLLNISTEVIPSDNFEKKYNLLHLWLAAFIYLQGTILTMFVSVMLCLFWMLRKQPEVKATSPLLSVNIFVGCYLLIIASVLLPTRQLVLFHNSSIFVTLCYLSEVFADTGINLITGTVLMRVIRIYRIFTNIPQMGWFWRNKPLFAIVIVIAFIPNIVTFIETLSGTTKEYKEDEKYMLDQNPPIVVITITCFSEYTEVYNLITTGYTVFLLLLLLVFALLTRNIKKKHFKDTKKVTSFIFTFTLFGTILIPVSYILKSQGKENSAVVVLSYICQLVILLTQLFLITPKVIPTCYHHYYKRENSSNVKQEENVTICNMICLLSVRAVRIVFHYVSITDDKIPSDSVNF